MFLNETNPPLDEALAHFGVKGMRWGQRRAAKAEARSAARINRDMEKDLFKEERHDRRKKQLAVGALALAGTAATVIVLRQNGHLKIPTSLLENNRAERDSARKIATDARAAYKNSKLGSKTFTPRGHANPLWTVNPKKAKQAKTAEDFINAGFGKDGVFNVTNMARGSERMRNMDPDIWNIPMLALTSGRK